LCNKNIFILRSLSLTLFLIFLSIAFSGCVTRKKKSDLSLLGKIYENTTARYNGYFNANEILELNKLALSTQDPVNFQKKLPIYPYLTASNRKSAGQELDKAVKKVTRVVALHPRSYWMDDCYLLAGQAWFLKEDYENAEKAFRYLITEYDPEEQLAREQDKSKAESKKSALSPKQKAKQREKAKKEALKKRKKYNKEVKKRKIQNAKRKKQGKAALPSKPKPKENDSAAEKAKKEEAEKRKQAAAEAKKEAKAAQPTRYFLKHRPVFQEGKLWLAKTLIERDNDDTALRILEKLHEDETTFEYILEEVYPLLAFYYLKKNNVAAANDALAKAISIIPDRKEKARLSFLSGQLYAENNREAEAFSAFDQAEKWASNYEMAFNAAMNKAQLTWLAGKGSYEDALANLDKLAKDEKNIDYLDQLYFNKGQLALKNKHREEAIGFFKTSMAKNTVNTLQKTESAFMLGSLFFENGEFLAAKNYLDTTLQTMADEDPRKPKTSKLRESLTEIADLIETISLQDSLIRISKLSPEERMQLALKLKKAEDEKRMAEIEKKNQGSIGPLPVTARENAFSGLNTGLPNQSSFFAYDDQTLKRGIREFERVWGSRTLQDNWRQGGQKLAFETPDPAVTEVDSTTTSKKNKLLKVTDLTDEDLDRLLGDYPKTDIALKAAELKIIDALFKLGILYREKLANYPESIKTFTTLDNRFPGTNIEVNIWYYLFLTYRENNQLTESELFKSKILDKYGSTYFAQAISDPNFMVSSKLKEKELNQYYDQTYQLFLDRKYAEAMNLISQAPAKIGSITTLNARFALLGALCTGSLKGREEYIYALQEVIAKHPGTDEQRKAAEILRLLGEAQASMPGQRVDESGQFQIEADQVHYVIFLFPEAVDLNSVKIGVSDFNRKYFSLEKLNMTNLFLGEDEASRKALLILRRFNNQGSALNYYLTAEKNKEELKLNQTPHDLFIIGLNNYRELLRIKNTNAYLDFFQRNILKN
jgi:hypothetical protein